MMFNEFIGKEVVLMVRMGDVILPMRGVPLSETDATVHFKISDGWFVDVYKAMIISARTTKGAGQ